MIESAKNRRSHLVALILSFGALALVALLTGGLERLLPWLALGAVCVGLPLFLLQGVVVRWLLEPAERLLARPAGEATPSADAIRRGLAAVEAFAVRDAANSLLLWLVGGLVVILTMALLMGINTWQGGQLGLMTACGALIDVVLRVHANARLVAGVRERLEAMLPPGETWRSQGGHLAGRLVAAGMLVLLVCVAGLGSIVASRFRQQRIDEVLASRTPSIERVQRELDAALRKGPDQDPGVALEEAEPNSKLRRQFVVLSGKGQVVAGQARADRTWLRRIVERGARHWTELQPPFLFLARPVAGQRVLVWIGDLEDIEGWLRGLAWPILGGILLMCGLGLLMLWSVISSGLRPLGGLADRVRRLAEGKFDAGGALSGHGEVAEVQRALQSLTGRLRSTVEQGGVLEARLAALAEECIVQTDRVRVGGESRQATAEKTASSVLQMRSAILGIGEQVDALRISSSDCSSALLEIDQSVREVSTAASNFQGMVDDTASAMREIARSVQEVAGHVEELARRANEAVSSIGLMDGAIRQVEGTTREVRELSGSVSDIAGRGAQSVRETLIGIQEIQSVTDEARQVINRLGTRMDEVGKILVVIGDVAEKTNLLALNAAIIAAAAGEHGRAFGVVADEIKDLADRTATSTKEIAALIKTVQSDSRKAVDAIERGSASVRHGAQLAENASLALNQIHAAVSQVSERAEEVARNTGEHSQLAHRITKSMGEISSMVRDIRRAMEEQTLATARVDRTSEQMREDARFVGRSAGEQVQAVSGVTRNMERMTEMVGFIARAMGEQSQGVSHVAEATEDLRDGQMQESAVVLELQQIAEQMRAAVADIREWLGRLRRDRGGPKA